MTLSPRLVSPRPEGLERFVLCLRGMAAVLVLSCASGSVRAAEQAGLTTVSSNAELALMPVSRARAVLRLGVTGPGDAPPLLFLASDERCASEKGDVGSETPSLDGKCWRASYDGTRADLREWGVSTAREDNGPAIDAAFAWAAKVGGATLSLPGGTFRLASTFDCHSAAGVTFEGVGDGATVLSRTSDYGDTMTCSRTQNVYVRRLWAVHQIGVENGPHPQEAFRNPTNESAHFHFTDVSHFVFENVTAWNMNYNFEIIRCIDGLWDNVHTAGYWDGIHNQTRASFYFDGADGVGLGHPQLMTIRNSLLLSYIQTGVAKEMTFGTQSRKVENFNEALGPYDHILIKSMEGFYLEGGGDAGDAYHATLHLAPRGDKNRPILEIRSNGYWFDGAAFADIDIENAGVETCNDYTAAHRVSIENSAFNGELTGRSAIMVEDASSCPAATDLYIANAHAESHISTPFVIGSAVGGALTNSSAHAYDWYGIYSQDRAQSSAVTLFGKTANFVVRSFVAGGGRSNPPSPQDGVAVLGTLSNVTVQNIDDQSRRKETNADK